MYTIGQVSKFLGISRDTLKFYEDKGLVNPKKNDENGYRIYNQVDIYDIATINFYREIDIEIKKIQEIRKSKSINNLELLLEEKEQIILKEIEYKKLLLKKVTVSQRRLWQNKNIFWKIHNKRNEAFGVKGKIKHVTNYEEYEALKENTNNLKKQLH